MNFSIILLETPYIVIVEYFNQTSANRLSKKIRQLLKYQVWIGLKMYYVNLVYTFNDFLTV